MPFTCDGAGLLWPDVAWRLALLAPNLAPGDIVSRVNVRTAAANFEAGSRSSTIKDLQLRKLQNGVRSSPVLAGTPVIRPGQYCICLSRVLIGAVSWPMPCLVFRFCCSRRQDRRVQQDCNHQAGRPGREIYYKETGVPRRAPGLLRACFGAGIGGPQLQVNSGSSCSLFAVVPGPLAPAGAL